MRSIESMRRSGAATLLATTAALSMLLPSGAIAQTAVPTAQSTLPADPWPRDINIAGAVVLVYQPQVNSWNGNRLDFRVAMAIKPSGAKAP